MNEATIAHMKPHKEGAKIADAMNEALLPRLSDRFACDELIVIAADSANGLYAVMTYGNTQEKCRRLKSTGDEIEDLISKGKIRL